MEDSMQRRAFIDSAIAAASGLVLRPLAGSATVEAAGKYRLRYAPRLDFLRDELTIPQRLEVFAKHGFDATEYNGLMSHPLGEVEEMRKTLDSLGMEMGIFVANPGGWKAAGLVDPAHRDAFVGELKKALEYHQVIGNRWCTIITGPERPGWPRGQQRIHVIDGLRKAAEILEPTQLTVVLEPLNLWVDHAGYYLVNSDEAAEVMHAVGSAHVKILFDIYHQQISEGNLVNNIRRYWDYIGYFQVGDVPGRKEPGTGEVNWRNVFKAIHEKGYKGILGMEHGLSQPGMAGLLKCFEEYRQADAW
jgi:hydroxypyruvate isomerase